MNIVVVIDRVADRRNFINDATKWVLTHPVSRSLYSVGMANRVQIGPYIINFVSMMSDVRGLRSINILYYHNTDISNMLKWEIEHRMAQDGKKFFFLDEFMEEVFRRAGEELLKAKLNDRFGLRPIAINYPELFLTLTDRGNSKIGDVQDILDYNVATVYDTVYDTVREARGRAIYDKMALYYQPTEPYKLNAAICIKEETTMNCDIRSNIKDVIFNYPATIILWKDGTKTIVKAGKNDKYDPEKGFAMAIAKKMFGNEGNYYEVFKEYLPIPYYIPEKNDIIVKDLDVAEEVNKIIEDILIKWRLKHKEWPGLTRRKWKELINKVAKRVEERRKREKAKADHKKKKEGIRSGKCYWGIDLSECMTPPEDDTNSSDKEE